MLVTAFLQGYRDANCLFMEMRVDKDSATTSYHEHGKSDYCLCLAIHAPRKGIIEVSLRIAACCLLGHAYVDVVIQCLTVTFHSSSNDDS